MNLITHQQPGKVGANSPGNEERFYSFHKKPASPQYAWLEQDGGLWHFLTTPFTDCIASLRKWPSEQEALVELNKEGWSIVFPYGQKQHGKTRDGYSGYGLKRILH